MGDRWERIDRERCWDDTIRQVTADVRQDRGLKSDAAALAPRSSGILRLEYNVNARKPDHESCLCARA